MTLEIPSPTKSDVSGINLSVPDVLRAIYEDFISHFRENDNLYKIVYKPENRCKEFYIYLSNLIVDGGLKDIFDQLNND